ncbi:ATPase P-type K/Mg/Cd/Cu/Zn/Na/Ca/Na/H-transporter [Penicillium sp. DV-2018c]|nr:ATPase P-type K/Mg/Cd/Cu/Zn/Na/Ca/Na/H-transporter [Penicillium sp. DV-2018c]
MAEPRGGPPDKGDSGVPPISKPQGTPVRDSIRSGQRGLDELQASSAEATVQVTEQRPRPSRHSATGSWVSYQGCLDAGVSPDLADQALRHQLGVASEEDYTWEYPKPYEVPEGMTRGGNGDSVPTNVSSVAQQGRECESLDSLIDSLIAEEGKDGDEEALPLNAGEIAELPSSLFETDMRYGLCDAEVLSRREKYGWNRMKKEKHNYFLQFLSFFNGPVQWVMEVAVILVAGLQDWIDFGVICALLLSNAVVAFAQQYHAGNIIASLRKTLALRAIVLRNGSLLEISSEEVVLGDIIYVKDGTIIAADDRLSLAVDKHKGDPIFASSVVKRGTALLVVVATGGHTSVENAALVNKAGNTTGHFTQVLNGMTSILMGLMAFTVAVIVVASCYRLNPIVQILKFVLGIIVVGVPVGLPVVVNMTMAVGASILAKKQAIVHNLSAIESLAGVDILCSDKTGTLTRNRLTLGDPYIAPGKTAEELMLTACLASKRTKGGIDHFDKAFIKGLRFYQQVKSQIGSYTTLKFYPLSPVSKKAAAFVKGPNGDELVCVKGAPMTILRMAGQDTTLPQVRDYEAKASEFAGRGIQALGVARKRQGKPWEILGIMPCLDPPRHDSAKAIAEAKSLGLAIKILTGDSVAIACEAARKLGLGTNIYNAKRLGITDRGSMPGSEVNDFVEAADGFADVRPWHRYSVVEILQRRGFLVAMTGGGVNDAASLKKADTGIAVEGASDAARSAADIVFLKSGLSAIIDAVKVSREIFRRMYAYVVYRIALSIHLELFLGLWVVVRNETLDLRLVALLAIFADVVALTIAYDHASYSQSPVKWSQTRLWGESIVLGFILALGTWVTFGAMLLRGDDGGVIEGWGSRDKVLFLEIALTQSWLILITRVTGSRSFFTVRPSTWLITAIVLVNVTGTLMAAYGAFGEPISWLTILRVWIVSFGITCAGALAFVLMQNSPRLNHSIMHGKGSRRNARERSWEDFFNG